MLLKFSEMLSWDGDGLGWDRTGQLAISLLFAYKESNIALMID